MSPSRVLKHLSVFVVVFLMTVAYVGNPTIVNAYKSGFAAALSSSTVSSSSSSQQFSTVPTSIPGILSEARLLGPVSPDMQLSLEFMLPLRNPVGLQSFLSEVYNPDSPLYHHFLTPSQFYAFYGPDPDEVAALITYMQSRGVQIHISATNPSVAEVKGAVSQIEEALKTQLDSFSWDGQVFYSATSQAQLPSLFSNVQMIYGLEDFVSQLGGTGAVPLYRTLGTVTPSQTPTGFPLYYSPSEIRQVYNATSLLNAGYTGTGMQIAIVDAYGDPFIEGELQNFSTEFGLPFYSRTLNIIPVGPYNPENGITYGWNVEVALDVEWAHAMAPNATINLYVAADSGRHLLDAVLNATLGSNGTAYGVYHNGIISMSWAEPENNWASSTPMDPVYGPNYPWLDQVFQMDAALGITAFASSGDWGAYDQTYGQTSPYGGASYPSTDPYVTGVGGTSLYMNTTSGYNQWPYANAVGTYANETAWSWNNYYGWGTGGGWSTLFGQPSWQTGPGVVNNGERGTPDVAWDADPQTGVLVSVFVGTYEYYIVGGTSVGSPCWAGSMALIDQKAGRSLGFIDPTIYSILNNSTEYSKVFHDITVGNNNPDSATTGWDPLTGVGSPNLGELANCLAPTGQLPVVVTNDFSNVSGLGRAYEYGQIVNLTAIVANNTMVSGVVTAAIISNAGATIASNAALTYSAPARAWLGSYMIKATDPSGEWSVTVTAENASSFGEGYTTFTVGDGVTIINPPSKTGYFYQVEDTVPVKSYVVDTNGNNVTSGVYAATFYLAQNQTMGNDLGKIEGKVTLQYNLLDRLWEGNFTVPRDADQGAWVMVVNGTDLEGNKGGAYTWINVGLDVSPFTDSPTYVLGDTISIFAHPGYADGVEADTGTFTALIYVGSVFVAKVALTFTHRTGLGLSYDELGLWKGTFASSADSPTGFYTITVNGTDGKGNYGSFATVVRMARYGLSVKTSVSNPIVPLQNGNESWILANVTYPDGGPVTVGNVVGELSLNLGGGVMSEIGWFTMTYNSTAGGFVVVNLFHAVNATITQIGNYTVDIDAYDASGDYGNATASFFVSGNNHAAIDITEDSQLTAANGVVGGRGSLINPYLIAGWNVSSISITNVTEVYVLLNDYVSGSAGNGITIDTPNSEPFVQYVYAVRNSGCGLYANGSAAGEYLEVIAGDNGKDGILIANDTQAEEGTVAESVVFNNALNGIVYETSSRPDFLFDAAVGNTQVGLLSQDSNDTSFLLNVVNGSAVGIKLTAQPGSWYGDAYIEENQLENNSVGIYVDGLGQNLTTKMVFGSLSNATVVGNLAFQNNIGIYAADQAIIFAESNTVAESGSIGISSLDSLAFLVDNFVFLNSGNGVQVVGQPEFEQQVFPPGYVYPSSSGMFGSIIATNEALLNGNATTGSGSGISVDDTNSSAILSNFCMLSGDNGIELNNVTGGGLINPTISVVFNYVENNTMNGIEADNASQVMFFGESKSSSIVGNLGKGNVQNGIKISRGSGNAFAGDLWEYNTQDGMLFTGGSSQNIVDGDQAEFNHHGFEIAQASWNTLDYVYAENNSGTTNSPGVGVVFGLGATDNYMFFYSTSSFNDVGVEFNGSQSNVVQSCSIWYNTLYGFYFVNGAQNDYVGNSLLGNGAPEYPTPPSLIITSPTERSTVNGTVTISWNESGESLAYTTVTIDGVTNTATGNSFLWNTTSLPDGEHAVVVNVTDTGGFSASQTIYLFTDNQLIASQASLNATLQNLQSELSSLNQTLTSSVASQASLNATLQNLQSELSSLNQTLTSSVASQASLNATLQKLGSAVSSLESQLGSLNATLRSTQAGVNGLKLDWYIAIAVVIVVAVVAMIAVMMRRRRKAVSGPEPSPVTQGG